MILFITEEAENKKNLLCNIQDTSHLKANKNLSQKDILF